MRKRQYNNKVLDKALRIIEALGYPEYVAMSLDDLSEALGVAKGTLVPYLITFECHQWLEQMQDLRWRIAPRLTRFAEGARQWFLSARVEIERTEKEHLG